MDYPQYQWPKGFSGGEAGIATADRYNAEVAQQVGDVNSTAKGSGARYNAGKPPLELIPFRVLAITAECELVESVLHKLGLFQFTGDVGYVEGCIFELKDYINDCAQVFDYGRHKYSEWNWAKGMKWSIPLACAGRHLMALDRGEEIDHESGLSHWGHVLCNLTMLVHYADHFNEGNDLPILPEDDNDPE
jgi:hypothetical protein